MAAQEGVDLRDGRSEDLIQDFLLKNSDTFRELHELRERGWANKAGDRFFKRQRKVADNADNRRRQEFFKLMMSIGDEMQTATSVFSLHGVEPRMLDLCMAPGGYTASCLKYTPSATVRAISLPESKGGHKVLVPFGKRNTRIQVQFLDITMLASELNPERTIPLEHPEREFFITGQIYFMRQLGHEFDLIFCDGQVLRTHSRLTYREENEATRLICAQLVMAMQRIRRGGSLVVLLHKADAFDTVKLIHQFHQFSRVTLFKPRKGHAMRSSFYMIATDMDPHHSTARQALGAWRKAWTDATFGPYLTSGLERAPTDDSECSDRVLESQAIAADFGDHLIELADPVWAIQRDALRKKSFCAEPKETTPVHTSDISVHMQNQTIDGDDS